MADTADLVEAVHRLKVDRDTWQAVASQYKAAFEVQTAHLQELQDICFAAQAELENEHAQNRRLHLSLDGVPHDCRPTLDVTEDHQGDPSFGTAVVLSPSRIDMSWRFRPSESCGNPIFKRVQQFSSQQNYGTALVEVERLLRGPLSAKARAEGLLLKSSILQATGPDALYDALAACSEALEICDRVSELETLLPKIQYQRGVFYYQLRMLNQARDAFRAVSEDNLLFERANEYRQSCDDELELLHFPNSRSAFDEKRSISINDSFLTHLDVGSSHGRIRRTSAQFRLRATAKAKRISLPHRWMASRSNETGLG
ncbi:[Formate-C-acetyltransferase]-activating enzyme [Ascochyta lentis]